MDSPNLTVKFTAVFQDNTAHDTSPKPASTSGSSRLPRIARPQQPQQRTAIYTMPAKFVSPTCLLVDAPDVPSGTNVSMQVSLNGVDFSTMRAPRGRNRNRRRGKRRESRQRLPRTRSRDEAKSEGDPSTQQAGRRLSNTEMPGLPSQRQSSPSHGRQPSPTARGSTRPLPRPPSTSDHRRSSRSQLSKRKSATRAASSSQTLKSQLSTGSDCYM